MWLLEAKTYRIHEFIDADQAPPYVILSHTWEADEVTFQEIRDQRESVQQKAGFRKIRFLCHQALLDGIDYAWIDTCCIDKSSSAELSEAINSMYAIYAQASTCYVYMVDVPETCVDISDEHARRLKDEITPTSHSEQSPEEPDPDLVKVSAFKWSRWFTRAWTLQELLAPPSVDFRNEGWGCVGRLHKLVLTVSEVTGIGCEVLLGGRSLEQCCVAEKFSWASFRATSRVEDQAYCLLGLFGVNMPLLYGERKNAFKRLQEELIRTTSDTSILAWHSLGMRRHVKYRDIELSVHPTWNGRELEPMPPWPLAMDLLASSVSDFSGCGNVRSSSLEEPESARGSFELDWSKAGLRVRLPVLPLNHWREGISFQLMLLGCRLADSTTTGQSELGILLQRPIHWNTTRVSVSGDASLRRYGGFSYVFADSPHLAEAGTMSHLEERIISWTGEKARPRWADEFGYKSMSVSRTGIHALLIPDDIEVLSAHPASTYNESARVLRMHGEEKLVAILLRKTLLDRPTIEAVLLLLPQFLSIKGQPLRLQFASFDTWSEVCQKLDEHVEKDTVPRYGDGDEYEGKLTALLASLHPRLLRWDSPARLGSTSLSQYAFRDLVAPDSLMPIPHVGMFIAGCESTERFTRFVSVKISFAYFTDQQQFYQDEQGGNEKVASASRRVF